MKKKYDFGAWATVYETQCADGLTIKSGAFKHNDGKKVPLLWNHKHNDISQVLGSAILRHSDKGVYAECTFNSTPSGQIAKTVVEQGDVDSVSIFANRLKRSYGDVFYGDIKELSIVLAGANPMAYIENVVKHGEILDDEIILHNATQLIDIPEDTIDDSVENQGEEEQQVDSETEKPVENSEELPIEKPEEVENQNGESEIKHLDDNDVKIDIVEEFEKFSPEQKELTAFLMLGKTSGENSIPNKIGDKTLKEILDAMTDVQTQVLYHLVDKTSDDILSSIKEDEKDDEEGETTMKHNFFSAQTQTKPQGDDYLSHSEVKDILNQARDNEVGSLRKFFEATAKAKMRANLEDSLAHSEMEMTDKEMDDFIAHGITNVSFLFPDHKNLTRTPTFIHDDMSWVSVVMKGISRSPFAKVKALHADITADEARAKGYVTGAEKTDEVFVLLKRTIDPTTIYKKQSMDRDNVLDITDFDVIAWMKAEMRMKLEEEIARAILIGDGRTAASPDKIKETNVIPVWTDADLYSIKEFIVSTTIDERVRNFIVAAVKSRKKYKGSGSPIMFTTEDMLADCLLARDNMGRDLFVDESALARKLRVRSIHTVPCMEGVTRDVAGVKHVPLGIILNLKDYNVGSDKGGQASMFDQFDIDFNKQKYLIETRISGGLVVPYSAIVIEEEEGTVTG